MRWWTRVNERPDPLGLYVFSEDESVVESILERTSSGDACVNDCAVHPLVEQLPFGSVGNSGMGKYHGHWGFEAFTNARGVLYHNALIDPGVKYPPYSRAHARARGDAEADVAPVVRRDDWEKSRRADSNRGPLHYE